MNKVPHKKRPPGADGNAGKAGKYVLRLYVTGPSTRSRRAIVNILDLCREALPGRYDLDVIDIQHDPALAKEAEILASPTLVKLLPLPLRRIIGDMSDRDVLLVGLGLKPKA